MIKMCIRDRLYTHAGPEIAVASTKAYTVQVASFYLIGCKIGLVSVSYTHLDVYKRQAEDW